MKKRLPQHIKLVHEACDKLGAGFTVTQNAAFLGVSRVTLSRLLNGAAAISPEMAIRLEEKFGVSAQTLLHAQADYDLAAVRKGGK